MKDWHPCLCIFVAEYRIIPTLPSLPQVEAVKHITQELGRQLPPPSDAETAAAAAAAAPVAATPASREAAPQLAAPGVTVLFDNPESSGADPSQLQLATVEQPPPQQAQQGQQ